MRREGSGAIKQTRAAVDPAARNWFLPPGGGSYLETESPVIMLSGSA